MFLLRGRHADFKFTALTDKDISELEGVFFGSLFPESGFFFLGSFLWVVKFFTEKKMMECGIDLCCDSNNEMVFRNHVTSTLIERKRKLLRKVNLWLETPKTHKKTKSVPQLLRFDTCHSHGSQVCGDRFAKHLPIHVGGDADRDKRFR